MLHRETVFTRFGYRLITDEKNLKKKKEKNKIPNSGSYLEKVLKIEIIHSFKKFFNVLGQKVEIYICIYMPIETLIRGRKAEK